MGRPGGLGPQCSVSLSLVSGGRQEELPGAEEGEDWMTGDSVLGTQDKANPEEAPFILKGAT